MKLQNGMIRLTILSDDIACAPYIAEHGFSLFIEKKEKLILFDSGQQTAVRNAAQAGIDLSRAEFLVLSHGHYDHTGGISEFLDVNRTCAVMMHRTAMEPHYSVKDGSVRKISMPDESRKSIASLECARILAIERPSIIDQDIGVICGIPRTTPYENTGGNFFKNEKLTQKDMIEDELTLWIKTDRGLIIITGCCHAGIVNTCEYAKEISGCGKIHGIIGGLHLLNASKERIENTIRYLSGQNVKKIVTCHCTGDNAVRAMRDHFGDDVVEGCCGKSIVL